MTKIFRWADEGDSVSETKPDCYAYVRRFYGVPAYVGMTVRVSGREGVLVNHRPSDQYVYILFEGDKRARGPYHPTDGIEYRFEAQS